MTFSANQKEIFYSALDNYVGLLHRMAYGSDLAQRETGGPMLDVACLGSIDGDITVKEAHDSLHSHPFRQTVSVTDERVCAGGLTIRQVMDTTRRYFENVHVALRAKGVSKDSIVDVKAIMAMGFCAACAVACQKNVSIGSGIDRCCNPAYQLGYVQGLLYCAGIYDLEQLSEHLSGN